MATANAPSRLASIQPTGAAYQPRRVGSCCWIKARASSRGLPPSGGGMRATPPAAAHPGDRPAFPAPACAGGGYCSASAVRVRRPISSPGDRVTAGGAERPLPPRARGGLWPRPAALAPLAASFCGVAPRRGAGQPHRFQPFALHVAPAIPATHPKRRDGGGVQRERCSSRDNGRPTGPGLRRVDGRGRLRT